MTRRLVLTTYAGIIAAWTLAWLLKPDFSGVGTDGGAAASSAYWFAAKLLIWIAPAYWLLRRCGVTLARTANLPGWRGWLKWGLLIGGAIAVTGIIPNALRGEPLTPTVWDYGTLNVLIIAPLFEEFLTRGALLTALQTGPRAFGFWAANALSSAAFVVLHMPGWYFTGSLMENLTRPLGGAFSIFLLGLCFGYAAHKGKSFLGGTVAHFLNNLFS